jgi:hypothetical protein
MALTDAVAAAVHGLRQACPDQEVLVREDGEGGAYVIVEDVPLGPPYASMSTWVGFRLPFTYPYSEVYPHFVRGDLARLDGGPLGPATSAGTFEGRPAIQVSRKSPRWDPTVDSAAGKLERVLAWLRIRP